MPSASRCVHDARLAGGASGSTQSSWKPPVQHVSVRSKLERVALLVKVSTPEAERERAAGAHLCRVTSHTSGLGPRARRAEENTRRDTVCSAFAPFAETLRTVCARSHSQLHEIVALYIILAHTRHAHAHALYSRMHVPRHAHGIMGVGAHHPLTGASASDPPGCSSAPGPVARRGGPARSGRAPGPSRARGSHSAATPTAAVRKRV